MIASGTPLLQAVQIGAEQSQSMKMRKVLEDIAARVASGSSLHAAAANYTKVFSHHWVEVIRTGEVTGQMSLVLLELNKQIQETRATQRKISGAMMYPIILVCVAVGAVTAMLWFVVPTFAKMFHDMGAELPAITQFVVNLSNWIVKYGVFVLLGIGAAVVRLSLVRAHRRRLPPRDGRYDGLAHGRRTDRAVGDVPVRLEHRPVAQERRSHAGDHRRARRRLSHRPVYREALERCTTAWPPAAPWPSRSKRRGCSPR